MKVLIVGGGNIGDSIVHFVNGLRWLEYDYKFIPTRQIKKEHGLIAVKEAVDKKIDWCDYIIMWNNKNDVTPEMIIEWKAKKPVVYWTIDPSPIKSNKRWYDIMEACDKLVFCCYEHLEEFKHKECIIGYPSCEKFSPVTDEDKKARYNSDVSFVAATIYSKSDYPEQFAVRGDIIRRAQKVTDKINLYGFWDERRTGWAVNGGITDAKLFRGWLNRQEHDACFRKAKVNLCSHVRPNLTRYYNERFMLILGSGSFMLCDAVNGIEEDFTDGVHLATWKTLDEFEDKLRYYLSHDAEREKIAIAGRKQAVKYHGCDVFARKCTELAGC